MDIPYGTQWNGGKSQTPQTDHMLYNSKGTMATVFHVKSVPWNCVMLHLGTGIFLYSDREISGGDLHLGSVAQPPSVSKLSLQAKVRKEKPSYQNHLSWSLLLPDEVFNRNSPNWQLLSAHP